MLVFFISFMMILVKAETFSLLDVNKGEVSIVQHHKLSGQSLPIDHLGTEEVSVWTNRKCTENCFRSRVQTIFVQKKNLPATSLTEIEIIIRHRNDVGSGLVDLLLNASKNIFVCKLMVGRKLYNFFFSSKKCVEQLHNYTIVNGLFFSLTWCVKCQNMCIKNVVVSLFRGMKIEKKTLSVGLCSSITARRAKLLLVSFNVFYSIFWCVKKLLKLNFSWWKQWK